MIKTNMIRIGVLSDTHLVKMSRETKQKIKELFRDTAILIHAGDMTSMEVYEYLNNWDFKAVAGNMDDDDLVSLLPRQRIEEIGGKRIGVTHGRGSPHGIEDVVYKEFHDVDIIIFGHSHIPLFTKRDRVIMFNPGAFKRSYSYAGSVGMIEIIDDTIQCRHIEV
jgi:putative phosphoesterase